MTYLEAIILGIIQGLTEFLPVSSSGHLVISKDLFGIETRDLTFEIVVHAATVMSTIVVFRKDIFQLIKGFFAFKYNEETDYLLKIAVSMIPIFVVGVFFKDFVTNIFGSGLLIVGLMLILTATLLYISEKIKPKQKEIGYKQAFIIGIAQSFAVMPGLSRSGTTIATGLMLGIDKSKIAKFSFLMVLVPILGETFLELIGGGFSVASSGLPVGVILVGAFSAFLSGLFACRLMINIVKRAKLRYFSLYCLIIGSIAIIYSIL